MSGIIDRFKAAIGMTKKASTKEVERELSKAVEMQSERHSAALSRAEATRRRLWDDVVHAERVAAGGKR